MFTQLKQHGLSLYSFPRSLFIGRSIKKELRINNLLRLLTPTIVIIVLIELFFRYTGSGYSVMVVLLLSVVLYTSYRSGPVLGILSALLVIMYNFYLISAIRDLPLLSFRTMESSVVIGVVFPVVALIIGTLKERNDLLLKQEHEARKKAESSAREFQFMADSMPQKIFTSQPDGTNVYINPQWDEYMGGKPINWLKIVHPEDYKENMELWRHSLETGEPFQFEHRLKLPSGKYVWHLTRANALRDKKDNIRLWVGSSTDIESVKKTKKLEADTARLIKQRTQLMELSRAKDEFISLASHQLRTPATSVKQYINMVLDGYGGEIPQPARTLLQTADTSNERQLSVINDLLRVAQVDAGKVVLHKEPVNLGILIRNIMKDHASMFEKREQQAEYKRPRRRIILQADPTKLRMAIENLIDNASKYSPANTTITVRASAGKDLRIIVHDEGVGINKSDSAKIFQKFIRLDNPLSTIAGGNGLGLYLVKKIIELHGGTISVTSIVGNGSTFTIKLPTPTP